MTDRFEVAVIGAGAAGLAAAKELTAQGIRFVLLEASIALAGGHTQSTHRMVRRLISDATGCIRPVSTPLFQLLTSIRFVMRSVMTMVRRPLF
ncbi:MAG: hypothetical protein Ct9H300mP14_08020 [Gammaproteobacteria bacterium]|nr:MAG: hypothetical protein Ct9H300mP14_08020 [Gammaproteobacteria bacterium]